MAEIETALGSGRVERTMTTLKRRLLRPEESCMSPCIQPRTQSRFPTVLRASLGSCLYPDSSHHKMQVFYQDDRKRPIPSRAEFLIRNELRIP